MKIKDLKKFQEKHKLSDETEIRFYPGYLEHYYENTLHTSDAGRITRLELKDGVIIFHDSDWR